MRKTNKDKVEYGDWQTNADLAIAVCQWLKKQGINPQVVIEPTCGKGSFINAALHTFDTITDIYGIDINDDYISTTRDITDTYANKVNIHLFTQNIFLFDFSSIKKAIHGKQILVLGNPPWVTNSKLGAFGSDNVPMKSNYKHHAGIEAITGKGNFDIAEYICNKIFDVVCDEQAYIALLLKNSTIKNLVHQQAVHPYPFTSMQQYEIDAKREFSAAVSASLFVGETGKSHAQICSVFDFYKQTFLHQYGWVNNKFVANIELYQKSQYIDGISPFIWRSGIKHDCAKVMELNKTGGIYTNGFGEKVDIEEDVIFPLIKSSDIGKEYISDIKHYVIVTQKNTTEDTAILQKLYPKAYKYLQKYAYLLDNRKSVIYQRRSRFCIFGIGEYSFLPYKVVVSGLYKHCRFSLLCPIDNRPIMVDDTCYAIGFASKDEAIQTMQILNSDKVQSFIKSISFEDSKRIISKDLLMRIDINHIDENHCLSYALASKRYRQHSVPIATQMTLFN